MVPLITIFVRHAGSCRHKGDENWKRCDCRKHLRWSHNGRQYRTSAKTRSWAEAENKKRELEVKFKAGGQPAAFATDDRKTVGQAVQLFLTSKRTDGLDHDGLKKLERELDRFEKFLTERSKFLPSEIDLETLIQYRATWAELYPSSATRSQVQARLRRFLRFCHEAGWIERVPKLSPIKVDEPATMPLSKDEYMKLLTTVPKVFTDSEKAARVRALVQLMRHSGLAIRDAVTIERSSIVTDTKKKLTRVATARQKTGTPVSVPLPPDVAAELSAVLNGNRHVFWSGGGKATSAVTNWQHDLRALFRSAFGKDTQFTPHCLRDTAAVEWLSAGIPLEEVSKLLGHSSVKTTEKHYAPWVKARQERLDSLVVATWAKGAAQHG